MDGKTFCRNCLSSNVPLLEMSQESFEHNDLQVNFIECYNSITGSDVKPNESKICEICFRQLKAIYKFRNKKSKQTVNPIDPDPENEIIIPKTEIKTEEDEHVEDVFVKDVQAKPEAIQQPLKAKKKRPHYAKNHFCPHCPKSFLSPSALEKHILPVHKGVKLDLKRPYMCEECGKAFPSPAKLKTHSSAHFKGQPPLVCEYCSKRFHHADSVRKHIKARHQERTDVFKCDLCPRRASFETSKKFQDHQKLHSSKTACECMQCDKPFASYNDLLDHIHVHHKATPNSLDVKCQECKKTFITPTGLRHHVFIDHFSQRCVCEICGQSYSQKPALIAHMWIHNDNCPFPFLCPDEKCVYRTRIKHQFVDHLEKTHKITYDSKIHGVSSEQQIMEIMKQKDDLIAKDPSLANKKPPKEKVFKCEHCDSSFCNKNSLYRHRKLMHNVQYLECKHTDCNVRFKPTNPLLLWEHSFEHRGFMPFNCSVCSYKTAVKTSFQTHLINFHKITFDEDVHGYREETNTVVSSS